VFLRRFWAAFRAVFLFLLPEQASFQPPQVTVAVNKSRYLNEWMSIGAPLTLNQVAKGDTTLFRHFGKGFEPDADAFNGISTQAGRNGLPVLSAAMTSLEGTVTGRMEAGDHVIYLVTLTYAHSHRDQTGRTGSVTETTESGSSCHYRAGGKDEIVRTHVRHHETDDVHGLRIGR
jgi:flavin reductase (DIM6/NTAB) family NADH-FMN oxidoreductase RutF